MGQPAELVLHAWPGWVWLQHGTNAKLVLHAWPGSGDYVPHAWPGSAGLRAS